MADTSNPMPKPALDAKSNAENIKDTLESIVVAFILAFVFRAFVVEAFVIPTGSMASTLYGAQITHTCSTCGYEYAIGDRASKGQLICPNCDSGTDSVDERHVYGPDSGDRILVHKWPFHMPGDLLPPERWDVTVFKNPSDGTTNYIKRLVGLPGEVLEIIDGDIYTVTVETLEEANPALLERMLRLRGELAVYRRGGEVDGRRLSVSHFQKEYAEINAELVPLMNIERKTEAAQKSLWSITYDHDFLPNYLPLRSESERERVGWHPVETAAAKAWDTSRSEITFSSEADNWLAVQFGGKPIDDFYAYNSDGVRMVQSARPEDKRVAVGDVRLSFVWLPDAGSDGAIELRMNRDRDLFIARIRANGEVTLDHGVLTDGYHVDGDELTRVGKVELDSFQAGEAVAVEFANVDCRVTLQVGDGRIQHDYLIPPEKLLALCERQDQEIGGGTAVLETKVAIAARSMACRFRHVLLQRDVYYLAAVQSEGAMHNPSTQETIQNPFQRWRGWGTAGVPILLLPDRVEDGKTLYGEYFMLGDNSPASQDSRMWWHPGEHLIPLGDAYQLGTVPGDQLIGKAFFVYWPAGHRPFMMRRVGIIPNVGRMRWIR